MKNKFPKTNTFSAPDIAEYVKKVVQYRTVIKDYDYCPEEDFETDYYMVPGHFIFTVSGEPEWEDKIYNFSFLIKSFYMLAESEDNLSHRKIETILDGAKNKIYSEDLPNVIKPGHLRPNDWKPADIEFVKQKIKKIVDKKDRGRS